MSHPNRKIRVMRVRLPTVPLTAWLRLVNWTRDWLVLEAQARARVCLNRGCGMWE